MDRRTLLELFAGIPLAATLGVRTRADRVVVIGGGILGCAVAYRLARRGAEVTLCERDLIGAGASSKSAAWINAHHAKSPQHYFEINRLSTLAWRELEREVDGVRVKWGGRIEWSADEEGTRVLEEAARQQQRWGYPIELVDDAHLQEMVPSLVVDPDLRLAAYAALEGGVDPMGSLHALVAAAEANGAVVRIDTEVTGIDVRGDRVSAVRTSTGTIEADVVVVAAGVDTETIAGWLDVRVPLRAAPGVLGYTSGPGVDLPCIVAGPDVNIVPRPGGSHVIARGFVGEPVYSEQRPSSAVDEAEDVLRLIKRRFRGMDDAPLDTVTLGWRPLPVDGHPVAGFARNVTGLYPLVTHSGYSLAATLSSLAAIEILDGVSVDLLAPYRPTRF